MEIGYAELGGFCFGVVMELLEGQQLIRRGWTCFPLKEEKTGHYDEMYPSQLWYYAPDVLPVFDNASSAEGFLLTMMSSIRSGFDDEAMVNMITALTELFGINWYSKDDFGMIVDDSTASDWEKNNGLSY